MDVQIKQTLWHSASVTKDGRKMYAGVWRQTWMKIFDNTWILVQMDLLAPAYGQLGPWPTPELNP